MSSDNSSLPRVEHRSQRDSWHTPDTILAPVIAFNDGQPIGIDPCSDEMNPTGASSFFTAETNGLERSWAGRGLCFANVPYGDVGPWVTKIVAEAKLGKVEIIALTACRPGAGWYRGLQQEAAAIVEVKGRLRFVGADHGAPFPSAVSYFGPRVASFVRIFGELGHVILNFDRALMLVHDHEAVSQLQLNYARNRVDRFKS